MLKSNMATPELLLDDCSWEVKEDKGRWIGRLGYLDAHSMNGIVVGGTYKDGFIDIMPSSFDYCLAIDAFLDFRDRLRTGWVPKDCTEPSTLMALAVKSARRQR